MAKGMNLVILLGNLGSDPDLRITNSGKPVMTLSLATSKSVKEPNGSWGERTEWHRVVVWGKSAEGLSRILEKGHRISVEGELRTSKYTTQDGEVKYSTQVIARQVVLLTPKEGGGHHEQLSDEDISPVDDDDIPF